MQSSEAAFLCPACDMDSQRDALQQMKDGQQEALQLLKEEIGMLHAEVKQLKDSLSISQSMLSSLAERLRVLELGLGSKSPKSLYTPQLKRMLNNTISHHHQQPLNGNRSNVPA